MSSLNGSTGAVYTAIAGAAAVGGILFAQVYRAQDALEKRLAELREESRQARVELKEDVMERFRVVEETFRTRGVMIESNKSAIVALQASDVEIETQLRAMATVNNLDRASQDALLDLLVQCPTCRKPPRIYYPPGPGPSGTNGQH